jgi:hypothetical protein
VVEPSAPFTGITVSSHYVFKHIGETILLAASFDDGTPFGVPVQEMPNVRYVSDNESVVTIDKFGSLVSVQPGTTMIHIYYGNLSASATVVVPLGAAQNP